MDQEKIAKLIKKIREDSNLTQKQFAEKYNVTSQAVSKWENGKNLPDITLLKQICSDNNISIDNLLLDSNINTKKKINKKIIFVFIIIIFILISIFIFIHYKTDNTKNNFEFKTITTSCSKFKITGSIAYNTDKTSLYISDIEFCDEDNTIYEEIEYTMYEKNNTSLTEISSGSKKNNLTLEEYLKDLKINVYDYEQTCKILTNTELYIEISALYNDKTITYKIPLTLEDNCR